MYPLGTLDSSSTLLFFLPLGIVNCDCERPTFKIEAKKSSAKTLLTPKLLLEQELTRIRKCLPILKPPSPVSVSRTLLTGAVLSGSPQKSPTEQVSQKQAWKLRLSTTTLTGAVVHDGQAGPTTVSGRDLLLRPTGAFQRTAHRRRL